MATSYTYATLVTELEQHLSDTGADYVAELPNLIALAETKVLKDLDLTIFDVTVANIPFTSGNPLVTKPTGHLATDTLIYVNGSSYVTLKRRTYGFLQDYNPAAAAGVPEFFTEYSDSQWMVAKVPNATIANGICRYNKRPDGLTAANTSTWLSLNVGDLLCRAALIASAQYVQDDDLIATFNGEYKSELASARNEFHKLIRKKD